MKKKFIIALLLIATFTFSENAMSQTTETKPTAPTALPEANPADVSSMDAILKAVYDVISGEAGKQRDWNRFRSLFHPSARMIPTGKNPTTGVGVARAYTPDEYIQRSEPIMMKEGFFEREKARQVETFGGLTHVFSTYETFHKPDDKIPFMRGINSIQLLNDGKRWWVLTIMWQAETPELPLPEKYLKNN